ncbi:hypothetical protein M9434_005934 [Picochlorum sp. BPE23]|nr:hypothetical protein M9434_005934 [Picochlorum sp. BPE23]
MEEEEYRINDTVDYICGNNYTCIASQFPDSLLRLAPEISSRIQQYCREKGHDVTMYLLADTTYNSLSVDEVASSHIQADCVIHYGRASLTPVSRVPAFYVFPRQNDYRIEDVEMMQRIRDALEETGRSRVMCCIDQVYSHCMGTVQEEVSRCLRSDTTTATIVFPTLRSEGEACCRREATVAGYHMPEEEVSDDTVLVWFGAPDAPSKRHLMMTYNAFPWISIDPASNIVETGLPKDVMQVLRRRYFLVEKAREASIVGILVGTLGADGYKHSINSIRLAAEKSGKKTYTLLMGKPNPAKLANFPEIEIFVLVADPQGQILDSKEYYAPIITPHEAKIAFSDDLEWEQHAYRLDIDVFPSPEQHAMDPEGPCQTLAVQAQQALQITEPSQYGKKVAIQSSADYLVHSRTWTGVEAPCAGGEEKEASVIVKGQDGRAAHYSHE